MFSMTLEISLSGLLSYMLAYFKERFVIVLLELLEQGRSSNASETESRDSKSRQVVRGILPRKNMELVSFDMELDSSRHKLLKFKNIMVASNSKSDDSSDSILKMENMFSCKGKVGLQPGEAEEPSTLLKITEEENEMMKQALLETIMERKELVNDICQLFKTLSYSLHSKDEEVRRKSSYGSLIIKPSEI